MWEFEEVDFYENLLLSMSKTAVFNAEEKRAVEVVKLKRQYRKDKFPGIGPSLESANNLEAEYTESPIMLLEGASGFNIVYYRRHVIGIRQAFGAVEFGRSDIISVLKANPEHVIFGYSLSEVLLKIVQLGGDKHAK